MNVNSGAGTFVLQTAKGRQITVVTNTELLESQRSDRVFSLFDLK